MILSRTMRMEDYQELQPEILTIEGIKAAIQMWYPAQHVHRHWEYALALKTFWEVFGKEKRGILVSDQGCGAGFLAPMMYWLGYSVWLYECWSMGNAEQYMLEQMRRVGMQRQEKTGTYELRSRPLCELVAADRGVDAAFCISTIEHIGDYQKAFRDLLSTVKPGGMFFITSDFAEDEEDHYAYAGLRAGKMFNMKTYFELVDIAESENFKALACSGHAGFDWRWKEEYRLVNDYGFASLAMRRME